MFKVVVDRSVLIDHIRGRTAHFRQLNVAAASGELTLLLPFIVITELFAGNDAKKKAVRVRYDRLLEGIDVVGLSVISAKKAGELARSYKQIPDPADIFIAAIAIEQGARIATYNTRHFKQIRGVKLFDFAKLQ